MHNLLWARDDDERSTNTLTAIFLPRLLSLSLLVRSLLPSILPYYPQKDLMFLRIFLMNFHMYFLRIRRLQKHWIHARGLD